MKKQHFILSNALTILASGALLSVQRIFQQETIMQPIDNGPDDTVFEVVLYTENKSWAFSTYEKAHTTQDALEQAEQYFSLYLVHRDFNGLGKAAYACVIRESCARWFAKHSGKWALAQHPLEILLPPPVGISGKHALALVL